MNTTVIMVFGTFDVLHRGHLHFFRQARKLARKPFLVVSVARDLNVRRIKRALPLYTEQERYSAVAAIPLVDKVVLGSKTGYMAHIKKERPEIIALGYDQAAYTRNLQAQLRSVGLKTKVVRLAPYRPEKYKSSLIKQKMKK